MNIDRRKFLESLLGGAVLAASGKLYSIPSIVAPKNIQQHAVYRSAFVLDAVVLPLPQTFRKGDIITISGPSRYEIDPYTRRSTGRLQKFIIKADVVGDTAVLERFNG